jgi:hypothetical protein
VEVALERHAARRRLESRPEARGEWERLGRRSAAWQAGKLAARRVIASHDTSDLRRALAGRSVRDLGGSKRRHTDLDRQRAWTRQDEKGVTALRPRCVSSRKVHFMLSRPRYPNARREERAANWNC